MSHVRIREFTDPACPYAFSAEPSRWRLLWLYGDQIEWRRTMVVLSESPEEYAERGFTPEKMARGLRSMQKRFGMPIDARERPRMVASIDACRAVVAARVHAPDREVALLRALRVHDMAGDLLDEPSALCAVAREVGLDTDAFQGWLEDPEVEEELRADMEAARHPSRAARALDHKLADWDDGRRYTCPSYLMETPEGESLDLPGWQPPETYETALANLIPDVERQPLPESAEEVLRWAGEPLATAEVAALLERDLAGAHEDLAGVAEEEPVGADGYWTLASS